MVRFGQLGVTLSNAYEIKMCAGSTSPCNSAALPIPGVSVSIQKMHTLKPYLEC